MDGVIVLLTGDFHQILPFIPEGTIPDELEACLKSSYLWRHVRKLKLKTNMRFHLQGDLSASHSAQQLLAVGDEKVSADPINGLISVRSSFYNIVESIEELKTGV